MSDLTEVTDGTASTSIYRWCLAAYPPRYRSEHGEDILATIKDAHQNQSRVSLRECAALVVGGVQRRAADASADGPVRALFSALRGAAVVLLLVNVAVVITGLVHHWTTPTPMHWTYLGMRVGSAGVSAFMWVAALLSVAAVGLLGAGRRRWSGLTLLASGFFIAAAANWLTPLGVHNTTDLFVCGAVPFSAAFGDGGISSLGNVDFSLGVTLLVPAALLMFLPSRRVAGVSLVRGLALAFGALIALVVLSAVIPWLGQNPGLALLIGISGASVFAPIDGRISLAASAIMLVDLPLLTRALWSANILPQTSSDTPWIPTVLIAAVILAAWGWLWTGRRRAHLPANLVN